MEGRIRFSTLAGCVPDKAYHERAPTPSPGHALEMALAIPLSKKTGPSRKGVITPKDQGRVFNHQDGQYLTVSGADLYHEIKGHHAGKPLVFLHGGLGTIEDFNPILSELGKDYCLIGIDSGGRGNTNGPFSLLPVSIQIDT